MAIESDERYRQRVAGCWLGKAVGGTLGLPVDGSREPLSLSFYDPIPTDIVPSDDVEIQALFVSALDELEEPGVGRKLLTATWKESIESASDEYGIAKRNLAFGLTPPLSGAYDNWFNSAMGGAARSELWACLAPDNMDVAAAYAYEDAMVDHAGEGIWAEVFLASLQSGAFADGPVDGDALLDSALSQAPRNSRVYGVVTDTRAWWSETHDTAIVRERIVEKYDCPNYTDVAMNIAFIILGLLAGEGDFETSVCTTVNCGMATRTNGGAIGALLGILDPDGIPAKWLAPIGLSSAKTADADEKAPELSPADSALAPEPDVRALLARLDAIDAAIEADADVVELEVVAVELAESPGEPVVVLVAEGEEPEVVKAITVAEAEPAIEAAAGVDDVALGGSEAAPSTNLDDLLGLADLIVRVREKLAAKMPEFHDDETAVRRPMVTAGMAFVETMPTAESNAPILPAEANTLTFPGTIGMMPGEIVSTEGVLIKYAITVPSDCTARVMFNASSPNDVWLDGTHAFGTASPLMAPSFNRVPEDQRTDIALTAGKHELIAAIRKPEENKYLEWAVGIADAETLQWIPEAVYSAS